MPWRTMSEEKQREYLSLKLIEQQWEKDNFVESLFPDEGPLRRDLYKKHTEFFANGEKYRERCIMAANRVGKTLAGGYEVYNHATGLYKGWWTGKRFNKPCRIMVSGDTGITTRDILQGKLFGEYDNPGENCLIPKHLIGDTVPKAGIPRAYDMVKVKHVSGGWSEIYMRSYESGRKIFQGVELEVFWADEECPQDVYSEGLIRLATTKGIAILTFTPLSGLTPLVLSFLGDEFKPPEQRAAEGMGMQDIPISRQEAIKKESREKAYDRHLASQALTPYQQSVIDSMRPICVSDTALSRHREHIDYIANTGGNPKISWFDEDHDPIGPRVRLDMVECGIITEHEGRISLAEGIK